MSDLSALYRIRLNEEYERRLSLNSRFSKNSFAKFLELTPSYYSKMINGKIMLSLELAEQITKKLKLSDNERREFLLSVAEEQKCHALYQIDPELTKCDPNLQATNELPKKRK